MLNLISRSLKGTFPNDPQYSSRKAEVQTHGSSPLASGPGSWLIHAHCTIRLPPVFAWAARVTSTRNPRSAAWPHNPLRCAVALSRLWSGALHISTLFYFPSFLHLLILSLISFFLFTPRNLHKMCGRES